MKRRYNKEHKEWRKEVIAEFGNKCAVCGATNMLNCHHIIPSEFKAFRYDVNNGIALCPSHHTLGKWSAHKSAVWFNNWLHNNHYDLWKIALNRLLDLVEDESIKFDYNL